MERNFQFDVVEQQKHEYHTHTHTKQSRQTPEWREKALKLRIPEMIFFILQKLRLNGSVQTVNLWRTCDFEVRPDIDSFGD